MLPHRNQAAFPYHNLREHAFLKSPSILTRYTFAIWLATMISLNLLESLFFCKEDNQRFLSVESMNGHELLVSVLNLANLLQCIMIELPTIMY